MARDTIVSKKLLQSHDIFTWKTRTRASIDPAPIAAATNCDPIVLLPPSASVFESRVTPLFFGVRLYFVASWGRPMGAVALYLLQLSLNRSLQAGQILRSFF